MMNLRPIYYDTETTGIRSDKDRIVEIAAYDPINDVSFVHLVNPGIPIPSDASAIHGITDEMVADVGSFKEVGQKFVEFCSGPVVLIAHNNDAFDLHFLRAEFSRHELQMPAWEFIDSLKWARKYRRDLPRHSLQFLRECYQIPANTAHRALDDVIILHKVCSYMFDDLDITEIVKLLSEQKEIKHMPFGKHQGTPLQDVPKHYISWLKDNGALDKPENTQLKISFEKLGLLESA